MFSEYEKMSNAEVYHKAFHGLLMLPDPQRPGTFLGNSQREDFLPVLKRVLKELGKNEHVMVLDVGAGSGEIVDIAFKALPSATISIEEPNPHLLSRYQEEIKKHSNLTTGAVYPGAVEDFHQNEPGRKWLADLPSQDLILAVHMIYHLTPFTTVAPISPEQDLIEMLCALYAKLTVGGSIVVVYADQLRSMGGRIGYNHYEQGSPFYAKNLKTIWNSRNQLLKDGAIAMSIQERFPGTVCKLEVSETPSKFFARNLEELTVLNLSGELGTSDDGPFDTSKLRMAYSFIQDFGHEMGVAVETSDGPRKGMIGGNQPQIICEIRKVKAKNLPGHEFQSDLRKSG